LGERLVHEQRRGLGNDGAANGDALALAAREGLGLAVEVLGDAENLGCLADLLVDLVLGNLADLEREGEVVVDGQVWVQGVALKHHGDVAILGVHVVYHRTAYGDLAVGDVLETGDHAQRR